MTKIISSSLLAAMLAGAAPALAEPAHIQAGSLTCDISEGISVIIGSKREVDCIFTPSVPGKLEHYRGTITKLGIDIGQINQGSMIWLVYSPAKRLEGALQGDYAGAAANATLVVGLGANVLVGGLDQSIALQPVSVEGTVGFNVAVGIANLKLRYQP